MVVAWVGGGWHGGNVELALQHELARHELARLHEQSPSNCSTHNDLANLSASSQPQTTSNSCSRMKRNACKRVTKSTQFRNGMYDTIFFLRGLRPLKRTLRKTNWSYRDGTHIRTHARARTHLHTPACACCLVTWDLNACARRMAQVGAGAQSPDARTHAARTRTRTRPPALAAWAQVGAGALRPRAAQLHAKVGGGCGSWKKGVRSWRGL